MVRIRIKDVDQHGSVVAAISAVVRELGGEMMVADPSAMGGQTFATSGPGSGWTKKFSAIDYARAAIAEDIAMSRCQPSKSVVIDPDDGRIGHGVDEFDDGEWTGKVEWEEVSGVELLVPDKWDAARYPKALAMMVEAADTYANESDWTEDTNEYDVMAYGGDFDGKQIGSVEMSMKDFAAYIAGAQWPQGLIDLSDLSNVNGVDEEIESDQTVYLE